MSGTQASYDAVATAYADQLSDELGRKPLDRALLTAFARTNSTPPPAPAWASAVDPGHARAARTGRPRMWDVGCGPGHVTAFLAGLGLDAAGIDLSGQMVAQALTRRQPYPDAEIATERAYFLARAR